MSVARMVMAAIALTCLTGGLLRAQDQTSTQTSTVPKVLVMDREMVKFGKDAAHVKNEAAFVRAARAAKMPDRYLAVTTMTGPDEAWFLVGFDSYADWEKADAYDNSAKAVALTGPIMEKDGDFISEGSAVVATYNEKWSYRPETDVAHMRYFEIETIHLRPGHNKDWEELVALFKATAEKSNLDTHDIFFEAHFGAPNGTVYIFTPRKSLGEIDAAMGVGKAFEDALGEDGQRKWAQLVEAAVASSSVNIVQFSPEMSNPPEDWVKADPDFWKPKMTPAAKTAASAVSKPGAAMAAKQ